MPSFGTTSQARLDTCHPWLQQVMHEVIKTFDFSVICGHRGEQPQQDAYNAGKSKVQWPDSKHNSMPSHAIDIAPYPLDYEDRERFIYLAGYVMAIADRLGIPLRSGVDWDGDQVLSDETFRDLGHFELKD